MMAYSSDILSDSKARSTEKYGTLLYWQPAHVKIPVSSLSILNYSLKARYLLQVFVLIYLLVLYQYVYSWKTKSEF